MNEWKEYINLGQLFIGIIVAGITNWITLKFQVKVLGKQLNGVGAKIDRVAEKQNGSAERLSHIEGYMSGLSHGAFKPKGKSGHA